MCNRFIEDIAWKIGRNVAKCDCVELKNMCKVGIDFQLTSKNVRTLFTETEFYGAYGYDHSKMFTNFDYRKEFVDMAICYLHEGNIEKFMLLITHLSEHLFQSLDIDDSIKKYAKDMIKKHISCVPSSLLDKYYVHVGFGSWQERDELNLMEKLLEKRRMASIESRYQYIFVSLTYWLHIFLTLDKPRTFLLGVLANLQEKNEYNHMQNFKFENPVYKKNKMYGSFKKKLVEKIINILHCDCEKYDFEYVPVNVRNILKSFTFHSCKPNFMYDTCQLQNERENEEENKKVFPLFYDIALCYLYEKDYEEFVNIISQIGRRLDVSHWLKDHLNCIEYEQIKKYRVNIDMESTVCKLYIKDINRDNIIKKENVDTIHDMGEKLTDHDRYNVAFSSRYFNISFDRWLSDLLVHQDPLIHWQKIWERGLSQGWKSFL